MRILNGRGAVKDWNLNPCPPHSTSTYTCEITITLKVRSVIVVYQYFAIVQFTYKYTIHTIYAIFPSNPHFLPISGRWGFAGLEREMLKTYFSYPFSFTSQTKENLLFLSLFSHSLSIHPLFTPTKYKSLSEVADRCIFIAKSLTRRLVQ